MTNQISLPIFHLGTTEDGYMALYTSLEHLALDADNHDFKTVMEVKIDLGAAQRENTEAAQAMLDLFNLRGEINTSRAPEFALRILPEAFAEAALHNYCEGRRLDTAARAHESAELDNLHTL